ncbi:mechanosensitive ion channel family protein [Candidatus Saccharibacteria bacterium]|nr:mechanosensitive ion channel family protein [Candidatus Saccharibacteria bacterium]
MENFNLFWEELMKNKLVQSAIVILTSIIIYSIVHAIIMRGERKVNGRKMGRGSTYIKLILSAIRYIFIIITILTVLQINGVDVTSIMAGLGLIGVIIGLAVQDALKDIIRGFSIVSDRYFSVGDVIKYNNEQEGKVLEVGFRSTKLQSITNGCTVTVANRLIEQAEQCANSTSITVPMPYEVKVAEAEKLIDEIVEEIKKDENVTDAENLGVTDLADSSINYLVVIKTSAENRRKVRRMALKTTLLVFEKHHVDVPYPQRDVHIKK